MDNDDTNKKLSPKDAQEVMAFIQAIKTTSKDSIEVEKAKIQGYDNNSERLLQGHIASLDVQKHVTGLKFKDKGKNKIVIVIIAVLISILLMGCILTRQISFLIPLFKYLLLVAVSGAGGFGFGRSTEINNKSMRDKSMRDSR